MQEMCLENLGFRCRSILDHVMAAFFQTVIIIQDLMNFLTYLSLPGGGGVQFDNRTKQRMWQLPQLFAFIVTCGPYLESMSCI